MLFSKRDMKVDGEGARENGLTMGVAKEGYRWNDPCVNVKLSAIKKLIKLLEYIELISYCNYSLDSLLPLHSLFLPSFSLFYFFF